MGGNLAVESEPGTARPSSSARASARGGEPRRAQRAAGRRRALVVDSSEVARAVVRTHLEAWGWRSIEAATRTRPWRIRARARRAARSTSRSSTASRPTSTARSWPRASRTSSAIAACASC
jgi:hypothetical protein